MANIEELIQKISQQSGLSNTEIKEKIDKKKEELEFLINDIAAAHIIAKDLGVALGRPEGTKKPELTIKNLKQMEPGLSGIGLTGVILRIYHPIEFSREGTKQILAPFILHDGTDSIRTILWGNQARKVTEKKISRGSIIQIKQGYTKLGRTGDLELHLGDRGFLDIESKSDNKEFPDPNNEIMDLDIIDEELGEVDLKVVVMELGNLVTFNRADGNEGRVANIQVKGNRVTRRMVFWDDRAEAAFNFTRGDELLIQGARIKFDRNGSPEIQTTRSTYVTKTGHQSLPDLEASPSQIAVSQDSTEKTIAEIDSNDNNITLKARKGTVGHISEFSRKDGSTGSVGRAYIYDDTGVCTLVLWNEANSEFEAFQDQVIKIENLRVTTSKFHTIELHANSNTKFTEMEGQKFSDTPPIVKIQEINPEKGVACVEGVISNISEVREFNRSDGTTGRVASFSIQDNTDSTRIVAWDDNVEKLNSIEESSTKFVQIRYGGIRKNREDRIEIHLNPQSEVFTNTDVPPEYSEIEVSQQSDSSGYTAIEYIKTHLSELPDDADGDTIEIIGKVIRLFQQTPYYWGCSICKKKVEQQEDGEGWFCREHNEVEPKIHLRLSGLVDDGTGTIKATFFGMSGEILSGFKNTDIAQMKEKGTSDDDIFEELKKESEGKTVKLLGRVKLQTQEVQDETIERQELFVNRIRFPKPKELSEEILSELQ
ncbi:MAG: hypothetical protein ACTSRJ_06960 [Candidatus Hodarchaeales archaeon]